MRPLFSVVTPVYEPPLNVLRETIQSVLAQTFTDWEFILVDDHSPSDNVREVLRKAVASDRRIRLVERAANGGIVAASNDALAASSGAFVALLDHDDLLAPTALETVARALAEHDDVDYLYSDEDKLDSSGNYCGLFRKPDWSPEMLVVFTRGLTDRRTMTSFCACPSARAVSSTSLRCCITGAYSPDRPPLPSERSHTHGKPGKGRCKPTSIGSGSRLPPNWARILGSTGFDGLSIPRRR